MVNVSYWARWKRHAGIVAKAKHSSLLPLVLRYDAEITCLPFILKHYPALRGEMKQGKYHPSRHAAEVIHTSVSLRMSLIWLSPPHHPWPTLYIPCLLRNFLCKCHVLWSYSRASDFQLSKQWKINKSRGIDCKLGFCYDNKYWNTFFRFWSAITARRFI